MSVHPVIEIMDSYRDRREEIWRRILDNIALTPGPLSTPCWIWQGTDSGTGRGGGYPRFKLGGQTVAVHRVAATHVYGFLPGKKHLDHLCRNRMCVNPGHLEIVTHKTNCRRRDDAKRRSGAS